MATPKKFSHYRPHARVQERGELVHPVTGEVTRPPSMTKQEFVRESDINNIIKQYSSTGMLNHVSARAAQGVYADLPEPMEFQDALHQVEAANQAFMTLPAKLRDRFGSDPLRFLEFCSDPKNLDEMRTLGIAKPLPMPETPPKADEPEKPLEKPQGAP